MTHANMDKVFTVIVTYNGSPWIERCIRCLLAGSVQTTVVVIDNASTDNTVALLQKFADQVKIISNTDNKGFGAANNQGMQHAYDGGARFCFLLNQDCYVFENTIDLLVTAMTKNPSYGILCPVQLNATGNGMDNRAARYMRRYYPRENLLSSESNALYPLSFMNAAAWMMSRKCLEKTGLFHPAFFHYGEDNNYASRLPTHGLKLGLLPAARVIHDRSPRETDEKKLLLRKLKTIPLYTLTDLRKPFPLAYMLARRAWSRLSKKLRKAGPHFDADIAREKLWFTSRLREAMQIRSKTSMPGFLINKHEARD